MLTPRSNDVNREAELKRREEDPCSFGLLSLRLEQFPTFFTEKRGRPAPSELILPEGVKK